MDGQAKVSFRKAIALPANLQKMLETKEGIWFTKGEWVEKNMPEISSFIRKWKIIRLVLNSNEHEKIVSQIAPIRLSSLKYLHLISNNIVTIESLTSKDLPLLEEIYLQNNLVSQFKSMRYCYWPKIKIINISHNIGIQFNCLSQLSSANLQKLLVEITVSSGKQSEDVFWMFKLEAKNIQQFFIKMDKRVKKDKIFNKKYEKIRYNY